MHRFFASSCLALLIFLAASISAKSQKYDHFEVENNDLFWRYTYEYRGLKDSLRREVVQILKSKFFTFTVTRNETGYSGEIKYYKLECKKYGRTYLNTPRMYWDGEWTGKFYIDIADNIYTVTIYALYYEKMQRTSDYYRTEKAVKGRYVDAVLKKGKTDFKKNELVNMDMMGLGFKDEFDIKNTFQIH